MSDLSIPSYDFLTSCHHTLRMRPVQGRVTNGLLCILSLTQLALEGREQCISFVNYE